MRSIFRFLGATLAVLLMAPAAAFAQAAITGVVKDSSGGVLPGVTVEAASPALIEKVRSVVTDGAGVYRIENLRPGTYAITFTLPGFNKFRRDGVELSGSASVSVDGEMRVGALEETVTVTSQAALVDTSNTTTQRVLSQEVINAIPSGRLYSDLAAMVPGMKSGAGAVGQTQNTGGALGDTTTNLMIHGSRTVDMRITQNGLPTGTLQAGGGSSMSTANMTAAAEVTMDTGAVSAELPTGGPRINFIPKDGGNQFRGTIFSSFANNGMQGDNFTDRLTDRGLLSLDAVRMNADFNPGFGGPLKRDTLWFYAAGRILVADVYPGGILPNLNANNPSAWTYNPDQSGTLVENNAKWTDIQGRVTWQASPRNKFAASYDRQTRCSCPYYALATRAPEAGANRDVPTQYFTTAEWFSPVTSRLLVEGSVLYRMEHWENAPPKGYTPLIGVLNADNALQYRGGGISAPSGTYLSNDVPNWAMRGAVSYVTGSHSLKVGFNNIWGTQRNLTYAENQEALPLFYRAGTAGGVYQPNQVTQFSTPYEALSDQDLDLGIYAQDRWVLKNFTITGGVRLDVYKNSFPEQHAGPSIYAPTRNITFAERSNLDFKDVTPRLGVVWDVQGNGRTAVRASANKYLNGQSLQGLGTAPNPILTLVNSASRSWTDTDRDWVVDCDLVSVAAQSPATTGSTDTCGSITANFGKSVPGATYDPELLTGWGNRLYNWEFAIGVQRELTSKLSIDAGYYRRIFGNFQATDNLAFSAADFDPYSVVVPGNPTAGAAQLPNAGETITGFYNIKPEVAGRAFNNYNTLASNYGKQTEHWNGYDVTLTARLTNLTLSGGFSSGSLMTDSCEISAALPEILAGATAASLSTTVTPQAFCHQEEPFLTDARFQGIYRIPKIDVQVAGTYQTVPGPNVLANYTATSAFLQPFLGRPLSAQATSQTINLLIPNSEYGERVNQIDLRVSKIFRMSGARRLLAGIDIYNLTNADTVLAQNNTYTTNSTVWTRPTQIVMARFFKLSATFDF